MNTLCKQCNKEFFSRFREDRKQYTQFCSRVCFHTSLNNKLLKNNCLYCRIEFKTRAVRLKSGRGKYCSRICYDKSKIGATGFWKDKKRSTPWMIGSKNIQWRGGFVTTHRERAKGVGGTHTITEWNNLKKKYNFMCLCCKQQEPFIKLTKDHVVPLLLWAEWEKKNKPTFKGNSIENIQPLCVSCNSRKNAKLVDYRDKTLWANAI